MIEETEPNPAGLPRMRNATVSGEVRTWLAERGHLTGADRVRAQLALSLAAKLDAGDELPAYALAKVSTELRQVMAELDGTPAHAGAPEVRRMLTEMMPR